MGFFSFNRDSVNPGPTLELSNRIRLSLSFCRIKSPINYYWWANNPSVQHAKDREIKQDEWHLW